MLNNYIQLYRPLLVFLLFETEKLSKYLALSILINLEAFFLPHFYINPLLVSHPTTISSPTIFINYIM